MAHPAATGMDYPPLLELAETLYPRFDVVAFDLQGARRERRALRS